MLFVPPSMPYMVPEAEAQDNSTGSDYQYVDTCSADSFYTLCRPVRQLNMLPGSISAVTGLPFT